MKTLVKLGKCIPDKPYLQMVFFKHFHRFINWKAPQTFNEKLQWLKIYDRNPFYTKLVDKYAVREYIKDQIGEEYLIPIAGGPWKSADEIDFDALPDRFVLKCTHDSKSVIICRNKAEFDAEASKKSIASHLSRNMFWYGREWPYKNVPPRVIAEQYMEDSDGTGGLTDYKFHFFSGECKAILVIGNRFGANGVEKDFYSTEWEHLDLTRGKSMHSSAETVRPDNLDEMLKLGKILARDYPFVRIDFYNINGKIYFGEITFYPASGFIPFHPDKWDRTFGDWIKIQTDREAE